MMLGLEEFSRTVSRVYSTSDDPQRWQQTLTQLATSLDAAACTLALGAGRDRSVFSTSIDAAAMQEYDSYYHRLDFVMAVAERDPVGLVRGGWSLVAANKHTEFHNDWQRRHGMTDGLHVRLSDVPAATLIISAPPRDEPYETPERVRFVNALVPHIQRALSAGDELKRASGVEVDEGDAPGLIRHAVFVVGGGGRVMRMNAAAQAMARAADMVRVRHNLLQALASATDAELQAAILDALPASAGQGRKGGVVVAHRSLGQRPLVIRTVPLDTSDDPREARAAVVITDPARELPLPKELLRRLFHLTSTEHEVAVRMARGDELKTIADELAVSLATIKTHVQRIFAKTECHRQAELVRLLYAIAP